MSKFKMTTSIQIAAAPEAIWQVLIDFKSYPEWNPFITSLEGKPELGAQLKAQIAPPESKGMTFTPIVLKAQPNQEFVWLGKLFIKGLMDGEHSFFINDNGDGTCTFEQSEKFSGVLVGLFKKKLFHSTQKGFELMNEALKERVMSNAID